MAMQKQGSGLVRGYDLDGIIDTLGEDTDISSFTAGDLLKANDGTTLGKLAIGAEGEVLTVSGGVPAWVAAAGGGNFIASDGTTVIGAGDAVALDHADGPGTTVLTLNADGDGGTTDSDAIFRLRNVNDSYPGDLFAIGAEHVGSSSYSYGFTEYRGIHQGTGATLAAIRIGLTSSAFNRLEITGASTIDFNATVMASNYQLGSGTTFTGYNEGQGGSSTGTVRIYSGFGGGDVALGTASGPDDIWSLENHKFSSTLEQDVNDAGVAARFNQQGAGGILEVEDNGTTAFLVDANGSTRAGKASLATTATDGFLYIPSCAGAPTGVPSTVTGMLPLVVDDTSNQLYFYDGASWVAVN